MTDFHFDSDVLVAILRNKESGLSDWAKQFEMESKRISEIVRAELLLGVAKSVNAKSSREKVDHLLSRFSWIPFSGDAVEHYADIRYHLESEGTPIGPNDLIVAATARAAGATLITGNVREFSRVPDLALRDWRSEI